MRRMGWKDIGPKEAAAVIAVARTISPRSLPPAKAKSHELRLFDPAARLAVFGLRRAGPARRRLCRGRIRAAGADRGGEVESVSVRRGDRVKSGDADRRCWKPATPRSRWRRPKPPLPRLRRSSPTCRSAGGPRRSPCSKRPGVGAGAEGGGRARAGAARRPAEARHLDAGRIRPGQDRARRRRRRWSARREANLAVAKLPARPETIKAAENQVKQAKAALEQAKWRLSKRTIAAPSAGRIDDIIRNPGDLAGPSAPVLSMLPDGAVKLQALSARSRALPR